LVKIVGDLLFNFVLNDAESRVDVLNGIFEMFASDNTLQDQYFKESNGVELMSNVYDEMSKIKGDDYFNDAIVNLNGFVHYKRDFYKK
jgi:hypothetical protein